MIALVAVISFRSDCEGKRRRQNPRIMSFFASLIEMKNSFPLLASYSSTLSFAFAMSAFLPMGSRQRMHWQFGLYFSLMYWRRLVNSTPDAHIFVGTSRKMRWMRQYLGTSSLIITILRAA